MEGIIKIFVDFANWFWGPPILILIGVGGLYCTVATGFVQIRHFWYICTQTFGKMFSKPDSNDPNAVSPFSAAVAALASSIGASNIVGVPVAIAFGGPGAIFWMWVLAILGCATKYVEIVLGLAYREKNANGEYTGGPFYYCSKGLSEYGLGPIGKFMGAWFAFFLMIEIIPSIATQSVSAVQNAETLNLPPIATGVAIAVLVGLVVMGGFKRIASVTDKLVPFMAGIYLLAAVVVIILNIANLPGALASIFVHAFTPTAAAGGFAGSTVALALRWGAARGVYSNEAGMGTAPMAHATATVDHPVRQGMWGVFEVMVDTIIVCTVTALAVLTSGVWQEVGSDKAASMPSIAFSSVFGVAGDYLVTICVFLFVLSTIIVLVFYGEKQAEFLFGTAFARIWKYVYVAAILGGVFGGLEFLYQLTDFFLAMIVIPNMIAVLILAGKARSLTKEFFNTPGKYYLADMAAKKK
ncbi:MAG: sodium:alanine symporter family protein [Peptostreptococcaceae bacterium]|nr:sodium:alanine symporter family protein [Peptostreptococcaceae bacterium]